MRFFFALQKQTLQVYHQQDVENLDEKSNKKIDQAMQRSQNLVNKVDKMRKIGGLEPKRLTPENLRKTNDND